MIPLEEATAERRNPARRANGRRKDDPRYCRPSLLQFMMMLIFLMMFLTGKNLLVPLL